MYKCRLLDRPETEKDVTSDDAQTAADEYVNANTRPQPGDVYFVEVGLNRVLWRVECLMGGALRGFMTGRVTLAEARAELAGGTAQRITCSRPAKKEPRF